MKVIEFQINPRLYKDLFCESYHFAPRSSDKRHLGNIYFVGEIYNASNVDKQILKELSVLIKKEFYRTSKISPEEAFKRTVRILNKYLKNYTSKGIIKWLGNYNLLLLNINNYSLILAKSGATKILLLRNQELLDIGENLETQIITSSVDKFFSNILVGKLLFNDVIYILTQLLFDKFVDQVLDEITTLEKITHREVKKILRAHKRLLKEAQGIFSIILPEPVRRPRIFFSTGVIKIFSFIAFHKKIFLIIGLIIVLGVSYLIFKWGQ